MHHHHSARDNPHSHSHDLENADSTRIGWAFWLNQFGYHNVDPSQGIHFDSSITMMEMAALGHGIMLGRTCLVTNILESGRLVAPFEESIASSEAFFLATPVNQYSHPDVEAFRYWLITQAEGETVLVE